MHCERAEVLRRVYRCAVQAFQEMDPRQGGADAGVGKSELLPLERLQSVNQSEGFRYVTS